jgi:hypothetical protein
MITINTISPTRFSFNGVTYHKNFMPFVTGNKIAIINVYDGCITLTDAPTIFSDYTVNGVTYSSVNDLQSALLDVIYTRNSLTNAAITLTTTGNSGAATLTGITLNIPNYTLAGLGGVGGTGATNFLPKFTGGSTLGNSAVQEVNGNLGLGVTPSAWASGFTALQVKNASLWSTGNDASLTTNAYYDGSNYRYIGSAAATRVYHNTDGSINWATAPSGTAGNAISFTQAMTLDASGRLGIGTTSPTERLTVSGNLKLSGSSPYIDLNSSGWSGSAYIQTDINLAQNAAGDYFSFQNLAGKGFAFQRGTTTDMLINPSGNVGIGTTSPAQRLDVNGLINSTNGICVGGEGVSRFWTGTQAAYDAITTKVSTTVYLIT